MISQDEHVSWIRKLLDKSLLSKQLLKSDKLFAGVLISASCLLVVAAAQWLTPIPYGRAIWDFMFLLDGAYRISVGQIPHVDFSSPIGALSLYSTFLAQIISPAGNPFVGLHALNWLLAMPVVIGLVPKFSSRLAFVCAFSLLALIMLVPMTLDSTHLSEISYFASYNRFASGFLFLAGLWFVLPKSRWDGLLLGYVLSVLFFLKITAAVAVVGLVGAAFLLRLIPLRTCIVAAACLTGCALIVELTSGMVSGYFNDLLTMSAINQGRAVYALFNSAFRNWTIVLGLLILVVVEARALLAGKEYSWKRPKDMVPTVLNEGAFAVAAIIIVMGALFAESQNTGGLGLLAAAAILFHPAAWAGSSPRLITTSLLAAALVLPVVDTDIKRSTTALVRERNAIAPHSFDDVLPATRIPVATAEGAKLFNRLKLEWLDMAREVRNSGFFLDPDPTSNSPAAQLSWAESASEAARNFEKLGYRSKASRYAAISFVDPLSRVLKLEPARGTMLAFDVGRTVPRFTPEQASRYIKDADGVFVSSCEIALDADVAESFKSVLDAEFDKQQLHPCWEFFTRKPIP